MDRETKEARWKLLKNIANSRDSKAEFILSTLESAIINGDKTSLLVEKINNDYEDIDCYEGRTNISIGKIYLELSKVVGGKSPRQMVEEAIIESATRNLDNLSDEERAEAIELVAKIKLVNKAKRLRSRSNGRINKSGKTKTIPTENS